MRGADRSELEGAAFSAAELDGSSTSPPIKAPNAAQPRRPNGASLTCSLR